MDFCVWSNLILAISIHCQCALLSLHFRKIATVSHFGFFICVDFLCLSLTTSAEYYISVSSCASICCQLGAQSEKYHCEINVFWSIWHKMLNTILLASTESFEVKGLNYDNCISILHEIPRNVIFYILETYRKLHWKHYIMTVSILLFV